MPTARRALSVVFAAVAMLAATHATAFASGSMFVDQARAWSESSTSTDFFAVAHSVPSIGSLYVEYAPAESEWCSTAGISGDPETNPPTVLWKSWEAGENVSSTITDLTPGERYCAEMVLSTGTIAKSAMVSFIAGAVEIDELHLKSRTPVSSEVAGEIDTQEFASRVRAEYGPASSEFCAGASDTPDHTTPWIDYGPNGRPDPYFWITIDGLTTGAEYCVRLVSEAGPVTRHFAFRRFHAGAPDVSSRAFIRTGPDGTTARAEATVAPIGFATTYEFVYDEATSAFCSSGDGVPAYSTGQVGALSAIAPPGAPDVNAQLESLDSGVSYCGAFRATNSNGTVTGDPTTIRSAAPTIRLTKVEFDKPHGLAYVYARINPNGYATTFMPVKGGARGYWCASGGTYPEPTPVGSDGTELGIVDTEYHDVMVKFTGLVPQLNACAGIEATNSAGTATNNGAGLYYLLPPADPPTGSVGESSVPSPSAQAARCFAAKPRSVVGRRSGRQYALSARPSADRKSIAVAGSGAARRVTYVLGGKILNSRAHPPWNLTVGADEVASHAWLTASVDTGKVHLKLRLRLAIEAC